MKLQFLGTNGWFDNETGDTVCALLESKKCYVIFDAGNGIRKLDRHIKSKKPIFLFLSHLHLDHTFGFHIFPKFKFKNKIFVFCPPDLKKHLLKLVDHPYTMPFREMKLNVKVKELSKNCSELPFPAECKKLFHIDPSFGYRITLDGKNIAYCCDTGPSKNSIYLAREADILIHECAAVPKFQSGKWGHSNPEEAARIAQKAKCKKLILTHFSASRYVSPRDKQKALKTARKIFSQTIAAKDDMVLKI